LSLDTNPATDTISEIARMPIEIMNRKNKSRALNLIGAVFLWAVSAIPRTIISTAPFETGPGKLPFAIHFVYGTAPDDLTQPRDAKGVIPATTCA